VFIADAGFGCVPMVIYAAKKGIFIIACIKKNHAGFPQVRLLKDIYIYIERRRRATAG
jgi:hypothetical protein